MIRPAPVLVLSVLVGGFASCSSYEEPQRGVTNRSPAQETRADTSSVAHTQQLRRGQRALLLRVPRVGRLIARCGHDGDANVVFVAARLLPTAAITVDTGADDPVRRVVQPGYRVAVPATTGVADLQTWQVEPFAKANVGVTTISVAMGRSPGAPFYTCGFSAHAVTTREEP